MYILTFACISWSKFESWFSWHNVIYRWLGTVKWIWKRKEKLKRESYLLGARELVAHNKRTQGIQEKKTITLFTRLKFIESSTFNRLNIHWSILHVFLFRKFSYYTRREENFHTFRSFLDLNITLPSAEGRVTLNSKDYVFYANLN